MGKRSLKTLPLILALCFPALIFAESITLKSGKIIEGKIIEKTDKYIKIDFYGVLMPFYFDEIESIDGAKLEPSIFESKVQGKGSSPPKTAEEVVKKGEEYGKEGNYKEAISCFTKAIELYPNYAFAYFNRGITYGDEGDLERSISDYTQAIELNPKYAVAYSNRGLVYLREGNLDQAISDFSKAIEIKPDLVLAYVNRGGAYDQKGNSEQAILDYNKAIELNPNYAEAYYNRAVTYYLKQEFDKSWQDILKAQELGSSVSPQFFEELKRASGKDPSRLIEALAKENLTLDDFEKYTTYYYKNPEPDKLIAVVKAFISQDDLVSNIGSFGPMKHLVATVAHNNQKLISDLKDLEKAYSGQQQKAIQRILDGIDDFYSSPPDSTIQLDYLWAEFMATGDEASVKKIISVLDIYVDRKMRHPTDQDLDLALLEYSARWSLEANARQHEKVYEIIKKEVKTASGLRKTKLDEILKSVESQ